MDVVLDRVHLGDGVDIRRHRSLDDHGSRVRGIVRRHLGDALVVETRSGTVYVSELTIRTIEVAAPLRPSPYL